MDRLGQRKGAKSKLNPAWSGMGAGNKAAGTRRSR